VQDKAVAAAAALKPYSFNAAKLYGLELASNRTARTPWKYMTRWARTSARELPTTP